MQQAAHYSSAAVWQLYEQYGEVFAFGFGPIRFTWLVGADANRLMLQSRPEAFAMRRAYRFLHPIVGDNALILSDGHDHLTRRRLVQPAFHKGALADALSVITRQCHALTQGWREGQTLDLHDTVRPMVLTTICELLVGREALYRAPALIASISAMMDFANLPFLTQLCQVPLPGTAWWRFLQARRSTDALLYAEIRRRRAQSDPGEGVLALLLDAQDERGARLSDAEVRDQTLSLLSAGFDTTSAAITWTVYALLRHPTVLTEVKHEAHEVVGTAALELSHLKQLVVLERVVKESLRLYPPVPAGLREATEDVTFKGYRVAKGSLVAYSVYVTQRSSAYYRDPLAYKPDRWNPASAHYDAPTPFAYLPFGSGPRYCIGAGLATLIIKGVVLELVRHTALTPAWRDPVVETGNTVQPKGGLPLTVRALASQP